MPVGHSEKEIAEINERMRAANADMIECAIAAVEKALERFKRQER